MEFEHGGPELARVHKRSNDKKFFCHFTGFLEGIIASGEIETGEIEPLLAECKEFVFKVADGDAFDIVEDFDADLLGHASLEDAVEFRLREIDAECHKSQLNRFLGFCRGIVCDGVITVLEAQSVVDFVANWPDLLSVPGVSQIAISCIDAIEDDVIDKDEAGEICSAIEQVVGDSYADTGLAQTSGVASFHEHQLDHLDHELDGATIVLTGNFKVTPRRKFEERLAEYGAVVMRAVSSKTDFLIVGGEAARDWIEMNRGTKMRNALVQREKTGSPGFVSEGQLLSLMDV